MDALEMLYVCECDSEQICLESSMRNKQKKQAESSQLENR